MESGVTGAAGAPGAHPSHPAHLTHQSHLQIYRMRSQPLRRSRYWQEKLWLTVGPLPPVGACVK
jgi:hypothetical protein